MYEQIKNTHHIAFFIFISYIKKNVCIKKYQFVTSPSAQTPEKVNNIYSCLHHHRDCKLISYLFFVRYLWHLLTECDIHNIIPMLRKKRIKKKHNWSEKKINYNPANRRCTIYLAEGHIFSSEKKKKQPLKIGELTKHCQN